MGRSIRTDLVMEAHELLKENEFRQGPSGMREPPGVDVEHDGNDNIKVTRVKVTSPAGEASIGKPMGNYVTLEIPGLKENDQVLYEQTCRALASELIRVLDLYEKKVILVVGLGNWNVTPDSLGPKVVSGLWLQGICSNMYRSRLIRGKAGVCNCSWGIGHNWH